MREDYVKQFRNLTNRLKVINESPEFIDDEMPLEPSRIAPKEEIDLYYDLFNTIENEVMIYRGKSGDNFMAGGFFDGGEDLLNILMIYTSKPSYPIIPTQLRPDSVQVNYVGIDKNFSGDGLTSLVYQIISSKVDLISDKIQYRGGKRLWKSLSRKSVVPIYVFDGYKNDYIRDDHGVIITYNGKNITEESIWGGEDKQKILLVASTSPKK